MTDMDDKVKQALEWAKEYPKGSIVYILSEEIYRLLKGEYICKRCGLRKDDEHEKGDF